MFWSPGTWFVELAGVKFIHGVRDLALSHLWVVQSDARQLVNLGYNWGSYQLRYV